MFFDSTEIHYSLTWPDLVARRTKGWARETNGVKGEREKAIDTEHCYCHRETAHLNIVTVREKLCLPACLPEHCYCHKLCPFEHCYCHRETLPTWTLLLSQWNSACLNIVTVREKLCLPACLNTVTVTNSALLNTVTVTEKLCPPEHCYCHSETLPAWTLLLSQTLPTWTLLLSQTLPAWTLLLSQTLPFWTLLLSQRNSAHLNTVTVTVKLCLPEHCYCHKLCPSEHCYCHRETLPTWTLLLSQTLPTWTLLLSQTLPAWTLLLSQINSARLPEHCYCHRETVPAWTLLLSQRNCACLNTVTVTEKLCLPEHCYCHRETVPAWTLLLSQRNCACLNTVTVTEKLCLPEHCYCHRETVPAWTLLIIIRVCTSPVRLNSLLSSSPAVVLVKFFSQKDSMAALTRQWLCPCSVCPSISRKRHQSVTLNSLSHPWPFWEGISSQICRFEKTEKTPILHHSECTRTSFVQGVILSGNMRLILPIYKTNTYRCCAIHQNKNESNLFCGVHYVCALLWKRTYTMSFLKRAAVGGEGRLHFFSLVWLSQGKKSSFPAFTLAIKRRPLYKIFLGGCLGPTHLKKSKQRPNTWYAQEYDL